MAVNIVPSKWSMYNPQQLERVVFNAFRGSGIDTFTDPASQNPEKFTALTNVLPASSGGFRSRWGLRNRNESSASPFLSPKRMFTYAAAKDTTFSGTSDCSLILGTDGVNTSILYSELGSMPTYTMPAMASGDVHAVSSRSWFYTMNGYAPSYKIDWSQRTTPTLSLTGIVAPTGNYYSSGQPNALTLEGMVVFFGKNYTSAPTVTITSADGNGSGMAITAYLNGTYLAGFAITNVGSGYTANPTVSISGGGGTLTTGVALTIEVDLTPTDVGFGQLYMLTINGPMILNGGRQYGLASQSSVSGHVSDFIYTYTKALIYAGTLTSDLSSSGNYQILGAGGVSVKLQIASLPADPQVTSFVLLATSDGGSLEYMYGMNPTLPLSSFVYTGGSGYVYTFDDMLPDTFGDIYLTGPTLLTNNLYVDVDAYGNPVGIANNTPPQATLNKPIVHKNRMFATDGKSVYFSKSLGEVTTSTGLITSKWEEAWPGTNVLDLAYGNETIEALLSDGEVLYIGTDQNIYRLYGSSVVDFSIPAAVFRGVGVSSQDCWSVIYKDNVPSGYMWTTPDGKIMLSDFNTYDEVGKYASSLFSAFLPNAVVSVASVSYAAYSLVLFSLQGDNTSYRNFLVWDSKDGGWYYWTTFAEVFYPNDVPIVTYTDQYGVARVYCMQVPSTGSGGIYLSYFEPTAINDAPYGGTTNAIPWEIQTSWLDLGDPAATKVLNELELYTADSTTTISVYSARQPADFLSPVTVKSGPYTTSPFDSQKFYLAGSTSRGRYYQVNFSGSSKVPLNSPLLEAFSFEYFPLGRL